MDPLFRTTARTIALISAIALLSAPLAQARDIYRWVDEEGVAHYGDRPTPGSEPVPVRNGKPVAPSGKDAESEEMAKLRENQCQLAKTRYAEYNASARMVEKDDFGKERELSAEERLQAIAKAKSDVEAYCASDQP